MNGTAEKLINSGTGQTLGFGAKLLESNYVDHMLLDKASVDHANMYEQTLENTSALPHIHIQLAHRISKLLCLTNFALFAN